MEGADARPDTATRRDTEPEQQAALPRRITWENVAQRTDTGYR